MHFQEYNEDMNEAELSAKFQAYAEAETTSLAAKNLLKQANVLNMPLLEYITETGPEIRAIFDRMLAAEAQFRAESR